MSKTLVSFIIHTFGSLQSSTVMSSRHQYVIIMPDSRNKIYLKSVL